MDRDSLEWLSKWDFPDGKLPTMQQLIFAERHPERADPLAAHYLKIHPECRELIRLCLEGDDLESS